MEPQRPGLVKYTPLTPDQNAAIDKSVDEFLDGLLAALEAAPDGKMIALEPQPTECSSERGHFFDPEAGDRCYCGALKFKQSDGKNIVTLNRADPAPDLEELVWHRFPAEPDVVSGPKE